MRRLQPNFLGTVALEEKIHILNQQIDRLRNLNLSFFTMNADGLRSKSLPFKRTRMFKIRRLIQNFSINAFVLVASSQKLIKRLRI